MARRGQTAATYVTEHVGSKTHRPRGAGTSRIPRYAAPK